MQDHFCEPPPPVSVLPDWLDCNPSRSIKFQFRNTLFPQRILGGASTNMLHSIVETRHCAVKLVRTPVAIFGSLGVCIYVPASRDWLISYSFIHLT